MSFEVEKVDRLNGLAAMSKAIDLNAQAQPLTPIGRPTTTLELMAAQRVAVPRHVPEMMQRMKVLASVAGSEYYYQFPVRAKNKETGEWEQSFIEGPSIKLANDLAREYGNCGVETYVVDVGDSWVIYAKFVDIERGFTMVRPFQQRKSQKGLGTKDEARALDIALQVGVSKAIRNVIVNSLETYADFMFEEAKNGIIGKVRQNPELYRGKIRQRLGELSVAVKRVEAQVGRPIADWKPEDITRVIAQIKAVGDGMATAFEIWPEAAVFAGPDGTTEISNPVPADDTARAASAGGVLENGGGGQRADAEATPARRDEAAPVERAAPEQSATARVDNGAPTGVQDDQPGSSDHLSEGLMMALEELTKMAEPQIDDLLAIAAERLDESEYEKLKAAALERRKMLAQSKKAKR